MTPTLSEVNRFSYVYQEGHHRYRIAPIIEDYTSTEYLLVYIRTIKAIPPAITTRLLATDALCSFSGTSKKDLVRAGERAHIIYYEKYGAWILVEDHRGRVLRAHQLQYVETVVFDRG